MYYIGKVTGNCLFWTVLLLGLAILLIVSSCSVGPGADLAAAKRHQAAAEKARAEAEKIYAEGYSAAMAEMTDAAVGAMRADTRAAHPLQYYTELALKILALAIVSVGLVGGLVIGTGKVGDLVEAWQTLRGGDPAPAGLLPAGDGEIVTCKRHRITFSTKDWDRCPICKLAERQ